MKRILWIYASKMKRKRHNNASARQLSSLRKPPPVVPRRRGQQEGALHTDAVRACWRFGAAFGSISGVFVISAR
ncbi:hypothetical protein ACSFA8_18845 [Variovorax sp. RT4R15]|uniref:hypothetical protein n=1 Tax=Variovorax sp. RT4R15 TaxID=3443737 RepID=UPI003F447397